MRGNGVKPLALYFSSKSLLMLLAVTCLLNLMPLSAQAADDEIRIVAGLNSSNQILSDLEYLVSNLAGRDDSYQDNVYPNIDIFLIGVNRELPVRFDPIFSAEHGMELQPVIPYEEQVNVFLEDNLDPIGIIPKRDRRDRDLYELTGGVFEGWLRVLSGPNYVVIFPRKEEIPKGMKHPAELHKELVEQGHHLFAQLDNSKSKPETRTAAFELMRKNAVDGIQKRPDETQNAFELRKLVADEQLAVFQQWFVESSGLTLGGKLDQENAKATSSLIFGSIQGTQLEKDIQRGRDEASYFVPIEEAADAILQARVNFKYNEQAAAGLRKVYELSNTVTKEQIEKDEKTSADEKSARSKMADLLKEVLLKSSELGTLDAFLDIVPSGAAHVFILGVRADGQEQLTQIVQELPNARSGWKLEQGVAEAEGVKIHKLDLGDKAPKSLEKLYGPGHAQVYLAVSDKAFWLAFGADAQTVLSDRIKTVRTATDVKSDNVVLSLTAKLGPFAESLNALVNDDSSVIGDLMSAQRAERESRREAKKKEEGTEESRPARDAASSFLTFDWIDDVVDTMKNEDDTVQFSIVADEVGGLTGSGEARKGILKAIGTLIANFADENLQ